MDDIYTIVFYAVNGRGLGHVTRLLSIAEEVRKRLSFHRDRVQILFLTSSNHIPSISAAHFPSFKVPSENTDECTGEHSSLGRVVTKVIAGIIRELSPGLLVVDGSPAGAFGELVPSSNADPLQHCAHKVFVYRPVKQAIAESAVFRAQLTRYDHIIIPESGVTTPVLTSDDMSRVTVTGPIFNPAAEHLPTKNAIRRELGIDNDKYTIYISTGGGGYTEAEQRLHSICDAALQVPNVLLLVAAGPLYCGRAVNKTNVRWWTDAPSLHLMRAADIAISGAGCNSFNELMYLGIPTIFVPMITKADDQGARAYKAQAAGAGTVVSCGDITKSIPSIVASWRAQEMRQRVAKNARALIPRNGNVAAATALVRIVSEASGNHGLKARYEESN